MDTYYFHTEGLTVGYHGVPLIRNIEIGLKKGEILTLIGPNGAGKTTILKSIIRQLAPLGGVAVLDGRKMEELSGKELSRKLSVVLTERVRPEMMTCREFVNLLTARCGGIACVFTGNDETGYRYIFGSKTENTRPLCKALNGQFGGKGGGKPEMVQGSLSGTQEEIIAAIETVLQR